MKNKDIKVSRFECVQPNWNRVLNAARRTAGKMPKPKDYEPSTGFKRQILLAEHSPIRLLEYDFTWENIRMWVTVHLVRHHEGCEKFVHTQRVDRNFDLLTNEDLKYLLEDGPDGKQVISRDKLPQGLLNDMDMVCNAQAFINISRKRLCSCASPETRAAWKAVICAMHDIDPILAEKCVPECVYRGFCPEKKCCGYVNTEAYKKRLIEYRRMD